MVYYKTGTKIYQEKEDKDIKRKDEKKSWKTLETNKDRKNKL